MASQQNEKEEFLKSRGALHSDPDSVQDDAFKESEFFDARDLVQVRYEMLRSHFLDGRNVSEVSRVFGMSRQFFYRLAELFNNQGLYGLLPRKRGPKGPHKCSDEVLDLAEKIRANEPVRSSAELCDEIEATLGVELHPRTLEKALSLRKKKPLR